MNLKKGRVCMENPELVTGDLIATLLNCDGYYACPKDDAGKRIGPLVAYAGTYSTGSGPKNFVGEEFFNFAKLEQWPDIRNHFADLLAIRLMAAMKDRAEITVCLGAPMGGILLMADLGMHCGARTIFAEKKVTALPDGKNVLKEKFELVISRHDIARGRDNVVIVEDVCNNFSTTRKMIDLIEKGLGGKVVAIACFLNRSNQEAFEGLPVVSLEYRPTRQWRQDDPEVAEDVALGKVAWKPKNDWAVLRNFM